MSKHKKRFLIIFTVILVFIFSYSLVVWAVDEPVPTLPSRPVPTDPTMPLPNPPAPTGMNPPESSEKFYACNENNQCVEDPDGDYDDNTCDNDCDASTEKFYSCNENEQCVEDPDGEYNDGTCDEVCALLNSFPTQPTYTPPIQPTNLGQLIQQIFAWSLGILGISVFVMFFYSGFLWLTAAGNTAKIGEAKTHMTNAVFGAILLLSSYLILYTINPDFVKNTVNLPGLGENNSNNSGGGTQISCESPEVESPDPMPIMQEVRSESSFSNLDLKDKTPGGGREKFTAEVVKRLNEIDSNWGRKKSSSSAPISTDSLGYLRPDTSGSNRFEAIDIITSGGTLYRGCWGVVDSGQVWVAP